ncbi:hypothetical protein J6500_13890 [Bradyrhizobium sp. WSM 1704]|uniref:hypothetical protein n=1 Tax=Bradyrhizobium semiaridum TaxID=2821404 RepID=UPI001CE28C10|nr:hypothetical protein [Bradyrhizobium semiaridum]MCA6122979.1 hypothetical protein [Bradyrhizobium semiaridum]
MRQLITGLVAAVAVMAAAPAMACGFDLCAPPVYSAPVYNYGGCGGCGGGYGYGYGYAGVERLPDPDRYYISPAQQYYYVNQGPTYTGPGNWAPRPYYREGYALPYDGYRRHYGYRHYGYRHHYRPHYGYRAYGYRHGYAPHRYGAPLRRYY